jgi:hypothetical protein
MEEKTAAHPSTTHKDHQADLKYDHIRDAQHGNASDPQWTTLCRCMAAFNASPNKVVSDNEQDKMKES